MMMATTVGTGATSILEGLVRDYIIEHTVDREYVGDVQYLAKYDALRRYNYETPLQTAPQIPLESPNETPLHTAKKE